MTHHSPTFLEAFLARRIVQWSFGFVAGGWILLAPRALRPLSPPLPPGG